MSQINKKLYSPTDPLSSVQLEETDLFLHKHLGEYGGLKEEIKQSLKYTMGVNDQPGRLVVFYRSDEDITDALVMNKTKMEGYIPENVLVYIAIHNKFRGHGIGEQVAHHAIEYSHGDIARYVEPSNLANNLYQKLGFDNDYFEMRYSRSN